MTGVVASGELYCDFRPPETVGDPAWIVLGHRGVSNDQVVLALGEARFAQHSLLPVALLAAAAWERDTSHAKQGASTP